MDISESEDHIRKATHAVIAAAIRRLIRAVAFAGTFLLALPLFGACEVRSLSCNIDVIGELRSDDCVYAPDGTYYDSYDLNVSAGQVIAITVRSLDPALTNPFVWMTELGPSSAVAPEVGGATGATIWYRFTAAGRWRINAGTTDLFSRGRYVVHVDCFADSSPSSPRECVSQDLLCGQIAYWRLGAENCRFNSGQVYGWWEIYAIRGDVLSIEMNSAGFEPLFGIYFGGALLDSSNSTGLRTAKLSRFIETTGWYGIAATSVEPHSTGNYSLELKCGLSGCLFPYFTAPIEDQTARTGASAQFTLPLSYVGPFTATLQESFGTTAATTTSTQLTIPAAASAGEYRVVVQSPCGSAQSNAFDFRRDVSGSRRRSVRR